MLSPIFSLNAVLYPVPLSVSQYPGSKSTGYSSTSNRTVVLVLRILRVQYPGSTTRVPQGEHLAHKFHDKRFNLSYPVLKCANVTKCYDT